MRKALVRLGGIVVAITFLATLGAGTAAAADPITGKKYSDATRVISNRNGKPVVVTVNGSQLPQEDCIVTAWRQGGYLDSRGKKKREREFYLHLNCNNQVATAGHPGNSLMTPEGVQGKKLLDRAASINSNPERCYRSETALQNCRKFCATSGLCKVNI